MPHLPQCPYGSPASPCNFHSHLQQLSASALRTDRVIAKITTSTASCCCCSCIPIECMRIAMIFALSSSLTSPRLAPSRLFSSHLISRQPLSVCGFPGRVRQSLPMLIPIDSCFVASPHSVCVCFVCFVNVAMSDMVCPCLVSGSWNPATPHLISASYNIRIRTSVLHSCGRDLATGRKRHTKAYYKCRIHLVIYQQTTTSQQTGNRLLCCCAKPI